MLRMCVEAASSGGMHPQQPRPRPRLKRIGRRRAEPSAASGQGERSGSRGGAGEEIPGSREKSFVRLKRDDQVMFCKKYREIGNAIRTLHCITEAELRKQVEDSDELRQQMRNKMGHCDITSGCQAGG